MLWLGRLDSHDPMYGWLKHDVFPQLGLPPFNMTLDVYRLAASNQVYLYETSREGRSFRVVGKFYGTHWDSTSHKKYLLQREFKNIQRFKDLGFYDGSYQVVRCLGVNEGINYVLTTQYVEGLRLDHFMKEATFRGKRGLYTALSDLATYLRLLHSRSLSHRVKVDFHKMYAYFHETLNRLNGLITQRDKDELHRLARRWKKKSNMWQVSSVEIHGDCTPTNFIISKNPRLVALDLERSQRTDPAYDTGRVAGELKHHFLLYSGDGWKAEPFIRHFYDVYCSHTESPSHLFHDITDRNPYYQAITLLRIAKNRWFSKEHRRRLIDDSKQCLRY